MTSRVTVTRLKLICSHGTWSKGCFGFLSQESHPVLYFQTLLNTEFSWQLKIGTQYDINDARRECIPQEGRTDPGAGGNGESQAQALHHRSAALALLSVLPRHLHLHARSVGASSGGRLFPGGLGHDHLRLLHLFALLRHAPVQYHPRHFRLAKVNSHWIGWMFFLTSRHSHQSFPVQFLKFRRKKLYKLRNLVAISLSLKVNHSVNQSINRWINRTPNQSINRLIVFSLRCDPSLKINMVCDVPLGLFCSFGWVVSVFYRNFTEHAHHSALGRKFSAEKRVGNVVLPLITVQIPSVSLVNVGRWLVMMYVVRWHEIRNWWVICNYRVVMNLVQPVAWATPDFTQSNQSINQSIVGYGNPKNVCYEAYKHSISTAVNRRILPFFSAHEN